MTKYSDTEIKELSLAFQLIDFSQPKVHTVFCALTKTLEDLIINNTTEREYWFFKLGRIANFKKWEFNHTPPLVESKEVEQK
jgi:hypothetical protein